jgi:nucleoside-diphosphate-sugar epimerase
MKLLVIGGKGTIGKKVVAHFSKTHEIIIAGRTSGDVTVDIADNFGRCHSRYCGFQIY